MPVIFSLYFASFHKADNPDVVLILGLVLIIICGVTSILNFGKIRQTYISCILMVREKKDKYNEDLQNKEKHDHHIRELTAFEKIILRITKDKFKGRKEHVEAVENKNNNSNASEISSSSAAKSV